MYCVRYYQLVENKNLSSKKIPDRIGVIEYKVSVQASLVEVIASFPTLGSPPSGASKGFKSTVSIPGSFYLKNIPDI